MIRLEIIMDRTVEDIFLDYVAELKMEAADKKAAQKSTAPSTAAAAIPYTLVSEAKGDGLSGPRMGTHVWPEENSLFILYVEENMLEKLRCIIRTMRKKHPSNGISAFFVPHAEELI